ncbi:excinuclease ABC subunit UvrC [Streptomyces californicus]
MLPGLPSPRLLRRGLQATGPSAPAALLLGYIGKCQAPSVGRVTPEEHRELAEDLCAFMAGRTGTYIRRLEKDMAQAAEEMEYERAARLRHDDAGALKRAMEKSAVVLADATDARACITIAAEEEAEADLQIFHVRGGRVRGQRGWVTDKVEAVDTSGLVEHALQQLYGEERGDAVPKEVLHPPYPEDPDAVSQWLTDRRGSQVSLRIPQRGDQKKDLMATVQRNAQQALGLHKTKRASDLTTRSRAWRRSPRRWAWTPRRCASSATTSAVCRATTWWPPWWCSRTGWPAKQVPPLPDQGLRGPGRRPLDARGDRPPLQALPPGEGAHGGGGRAARVRRPGHGTAPPAAGPAPGSPETAEGPSAVGPVPGVPEAAGGPGALEGPAASAGLTAHSPHSPPQPPRAPPPPAPSRRRPSPPPPRTTRPAPGRRTAAPSG